MGKQANGWARFDDQYRDREPKKSHTPVDEVVNDQVQILGGQDAHDLAPLVPEEGPLQVRLPLDLGVYEEGSGHK